MIQNASLNVLNGGKSMDIKIEEDLVLLNIKAKDKVEVISKLANLLRKEGCVKDSYLNAVIKREGIFPTGLPTIPQSIAIPHTDAEHCLKTSVAVATLEEPVKFGLMGDDINTVDAKAVFLLAVDNKEKQVMFLSKLFHIFDDSNSLVKILNAKKPKEIVDELLRAIQS
jgi:PTS system galactitol-specific IIA component